MAPRKLQFSKVSTESVNWHGWWECRAGVTSVEE